MNCPVRNIRGDRCQLRADHPEAALDHDYPPARDEVIATLTRERDEWKLRAEIRDSHRTALIGMLSIAPTTPDLERVTAERDQGRRLHRCGWCHAAWFELADAHAHTRSCVHNPLVAERDQAQRDLAVLRTHLAMDAKHADEHAEQRSSAFWFAAWTEQTKRNAEIALELARLQKAAP